jgi:4-amino-4-deoxy-L-arabinose transferase-like glycosyltransferase
MVGPKTKRLFVIICGLLLAFLAYHLRYQHFADFPTINDTRDEYKYAFNGINLIKTGVPSSWSWFDDYKDFKLVNLRGSEYRLVRPYFEDPPLFGLMMGKYALTKGMDSLDKIDAGALRWPMLKLGALNVFLLFVLVYLVAGFKEALLAAALYATIPTMVLSSRLPLAENFLVTLSLGALICFWWYLKKESFWALLGCLLLTTPAILIKQSGAYIPLSLAALFFWQKKIKASFLVLLFFGLSVLAYLAYGYFYDWQFFWHMQSVFSGREILLPKMIIGLFETFRITEKMMTPDGIIIWGWISVAIYQLSRKNRQGAGRLILPLVVGFGLILFAIMSGHAKGWYRFPFHPFLAWAIAAVFFDNLKEPGFLASFFFITVPVFAAYVTGTGENYWSALQVKNYQLWLPALMVPFALYEIKKGERLKKIVQIVLMAAAILMVIMNARTILFFQDQFWY